MPFHHNTLSDEVHILIRGRIFKVKFRPDSFPKLIEIFTDWALPFWRALMPKEKFVTKVKLARGSYQYIDSHTCLYTDISQLLIIMNYVQRTQVVDKTFIFSKYICTLICIWRGQFYKINFKHNYIGKRWFEKSWAVAQFPYTVSIASFSWNGSVSFFTCLPRIRQYD